MKIIFTEQALFSLEEVLNFFAPKVTQEKLIEIRDATANLVLQPYIGYR